MDNPRPEKVAVVEEVKQKLTNSDAAILTEYRGLQVKDLAQLRSDLRNSGGEYKIYKNTLVRFAVRDLELNDLEASLTGPTAIAFVEGDPVAVAKALKEFAKTNPNLVVKGGVLGSKTLSAKDAAALAELPTRDVVLAQFAGLLAQPMRQFAGLLQALPRNFAYGLSALVEKRGGAPEADSNTADEATPDAEEAAADSNAEPDSAEGAAESTSAEAGEEATKNES